QAARVLSEWRKFVGVQWSSKNVVMNRWRRCLLASDAMTNGPHPLNEKYEMSSRDLNSQVMLSSVWNAGVHFAGLPCRTRIWAASNHSLRYLPHESSTFPLVCSSEALTAKVKQARSRSFLATRPRSRRFLVITFSPGRRYHDARWCTTTN